MNLRGQTGLPHPTLGLRRLLADNSSAVLSTNMLHLTNSNIHTFELLYSRTTQNTKHKPRLFIYFLLFLSRLLYIKIKINTEKGDVKILHIFVWLIVNLHFFILFEFIWTTLAELVNQTNKNGVQTEPKKSRNIESASFDIICYITYILNKNRI